MEDYLGSTFSLQQIGILVGTALAVPILADRIGLLRPVGLLYRLPIVLILAWLWIEFVWWWVAAIRVVAALALLVVLPVFYYLVLQPIRYLLALFTALVVDGSDKVEFGPVEGYFDAYPERYGRWCWDAIKWGFPTLWRLWRKGLGHS